VTSRRAPHIRKGELQMSIRKLVLPGLVVAALGVLGTANAASLTSAGFSDNFDELGTAGTALPSGWALYDGESGTSHSTWTSSILANGSSGSVASMVLNTTGLSASNAPSSTNNNGFNAEAVTATGALAGTSDRVIATSPTGIDGSAWQLTLTNNTGAALSSLNVSYDIDRLNSPSQTEELPGYELFYSTNGSTWTNVSQFNPTLTGAGGSPAVPNTNGVTTVSGTVTLAAAVASGANLELRWVDDNAVNPSPDQIIGLNNVNVAPVPLPPGLPLLLSALGGLGLFGWRPKKK
jgi:hypothetical protein